MPIKLIIRITKELLFVAASMFISLGCYCQTSGNLSIEISYGVNGNFFVRSYDEIGGPPNKTYLLKKNFIGTISEIAVNYGHIGIAYSRTVNKGTKNFEGSLTGITIQVLDFNLRHIDNLYQIYYHGLFKKGNPAWRYNVGLVLISDAQQLIHVENWNNSIDITERNYKNSRLVEGGLIGAIYFSKKIDTKFEIGMKSSIYYLVSTGSIEAISLTSSLKYRF